MRAMCLTLLLTVVESTCAFAQTPSVPNTINCADFIRRPNGDWYVAKRTKFDIGQMKGFELADQAITPHSFSVSGADLYDVITRKCGGDKI